MKKQTTDEIQLKKLFDLRKSLHAQPELAHKEYQTAQIIKSYISSYKPDQVIENIGGTGLAFIFKGLKEGPTVLIRSELDALPIEEINQLEYRSKIPNVSHKCGHDGHMTIVAGLAHLLTEEPLKRGRVILFFQPAEETGEGAFKVLRDEKFLELQPDYVFALHNLPGYESHTVLTRYDHFAATSRGMIIKLLGKTSHAAEPEHGNNPAPAAAEIISRFTTLAQDLKPDLKDFALVTVIHAKIGERAFGTTPGYGEVLATLRAYDENDMALISQKCQDLVKEIAFNNNLKFEVSWTEEFPATINNRYCVELIEKAAIQLNLNHIRIPQPFRWTEDFGHFTHHYKGALFGLGAGKNQPQLHNPDYDFPEAIIKTGIIVFFSIISQILIE